MAHTIINITGGDIVTELSAIIQNAGQELKRGTLVLAVLTQLTEPQYGYSMIQALNELGIEIEQNTLYPLLRRLEKQGLLESLWQVEDNRPRRYYQISAQGTALKEALIKEWEKLNEALSKMIKGGTYD